MKAKQTYISLTALLIAALTVIPGCRGGTGSSAQTSGGSSGDIQSDERLFPDLPDVTYDGYEFTFDQWDIDGWGMMQDIFAEASDESKVGSAVYRRNKTVEEKYKVTINDLLAENEQLEARAKASEKGKMKDTMERAKLKSELDNLQRLVDRIPPDILAELKRQQRHTRER